MLILPGKNFFLLIALLLANVSQAKELLGPEEGVVPYGMGRAYSAIADDWLSLYYNPAGLALVKNIDLQLFDLSLSSNDDVRKNYSHFKEVAKSSKGSLADSISELAGKHVMASAANVTQITVPNFALGVVYRAHTDFDLENLAYPTTQMRFTRDFAIIGGGAVTGGKRKEFRLGAAVKWIKRTGGMKEIPISEILGNDRKSIADLFNQTGTGLGGDVGLQYRLPIPGRVEYTASFVWHDIGKTSFGGVQAQNPPTRIEENAVAGLGIRFPIGGMKNRRLERRYGPSRSTSHLSFAFDYSHLNYSLNEEQFAKHCHLGMNLDLPILSLQLGLNQSSLSFGTSFDIGVLRIAMATYGEELGSFAGQKPDRRYLLSIGSALGFPSR